MRADAARRQVHALGESLFDLGFVNLAGAVRVDIDRQRTRNADRVGELNRAAVGDAGSHDVLGEIARGIGAERSTLVGSLPEKAPPPCGAAPP